jgi:hypothetical protein
VTRIDPDRRDLLGDLDLEGLGEREELLKGLGDGAFFSFCHPNARACEGRA